MATFKARELRRQLYRLLKKHPDALLEFNDMGGMAITKPHNEDLYHYDKHGPYHLALGHVDGEGKIHLIAEE